MYPDVISAGLMSSNNNQLTAAIVSGRFGTLRASSCTKIEMYYSCVSKRPRQLIKSCSSGLIAVFLHFATSNLSYVLKRAFCYVILLRFQFVGLSLIFGVS